MKPRITKELIRYYTEEEEVETLVGLDISLTTIAALIEGQTTATYGLDALRRRFLMDVLGKEIDPIKEEGDLKFWIPQISDALLRRLAKLESAKLPRVIDVVHSCSDPITKNLVELGYTNPVSVIRAKIGGGEYVNYHPERPVEDLAKFLKSQIDIEDLLPFAALAQDILDWIANHNRAVRRTE